MNPNLTLIDDLYEYLLLSSHVFVVLRPRRNEPMYVTGN